MTDNKECQAANPYKSFKEGSKVMAAVATVIMDQMLEAPDYLAREELKDMFTEICNKLLGNRP